MKKENFIKLSNALKNYIKFEDKLEEVLGNVIIEPMSDITCIISEVLENESGVPWGDDDFDNLYNTNIPGEDLYNLIETIKVVNKTEDYKK